MSIHHGAVAAGQSTACCWRDGGPVSDRQSEFSERDRQPAVHRRLDCQLVMPSPDVLDEGVSGDHDPGAAVLLEPTHRYQPRLQAAVVGFDSVVSVRLGSVPGRWEQFLQHPRIGRCPVSNDCRRQLRRVDGPRKEPVHRRCIPPWGHLHVNDLAELVDRTVDGPPAAADLHIRLVHGPAISNTMTAGSAASASSGVNRSTHR